MTVTYQDLDGDNVTVKFSKAILTGGNVNGVLKFDMGSVNGSNATKQQLQGIFLQNAAGASGTSISVTAVKSPTNGGDGLAHVGEIYAAGVDLGAVIVQGDLAQILAGDHTTATTGLASLRVLSMGQYGVSTGAASLASTVKGKLGSLTVKSDINEVSISVIGGSDGDIGTISIGGSLIGQGAAGGRITAMGDIGRIHLGGSLIGVGSASGAIIAGGNVGNVAIRGNIVGVGADSGTIGTTAAGGKIASVTVGGSLLGGGGTNSGRLFAQDFGPVRILRDFLGGDGEDSAQIDAGGHIASLQVGGAFQGGKGQFSARVNANSLGLVSVRGDVRVGDGEHSGAIVAGNGSIAGLTIGGSLVGGQNKTGGYVFAGGNLGAVKVAGSVLGSLGSNSGWIQANGKLGVASVGGSVSGFLSGASVVGVSIGGSLSGHVNSNGDLGSLAVNGSIDGSVSGGKVAAGGNIGAVKVGGSILGATAYQSGSVVSAGKIGSIVVGGSVRGGTGNYSGRVFAAGEISSISVGGDLVGGQAAFHLDSLSESGFVGAKRIGAMAIGGSLSARAKNNDFTFSRNGAVRVVDDIGSLLIRGDLVGHATNPATISARGQAAPSATADVAIGKLTVLGRVERAEILAGVELNGAPVNADAQIGSISVGLDWIASNAAAGAGRGADFKYGTADDVKFSGAMVKDVAGIISKIGSIRIGGQVIGTVGGSDHFGFVAEQVGAVRIGGTPLVLTPGAGNDDQWAGGTMDCKVQEV